MTEPTLLRDLAVILVVAGAVTIIFHRLHQPVVLGYILAGVIIGPHTPPFPLIQDEHTIHTLGELGVIFLMFCLGLEFSLAKLRKVGFTALITATLEVLSMGWVGYEIGRLYGWKTMDCLFLAAMLSMSSTTIIIKVLNDMGRGKELFAQLIFGILIVEDVLAMVLIALLSGIATTGSLATGDVLMATGKLGIFLVVTLVVGLLTVPRLLGFVARFKNNEMLLVTVLGLCFGVSLLAAKLEYSVALGAFVIGAIIAEARAIHRITAAMESIRDMFSAVFFVSVGLMIDPVLIGQYWQPILVITVAVVVCKIVADTFGVFLTGHDTRTSLRVGMGLAQIGEFSFIIATLGLSLKVMSEFLYAIAVSVSAITTLLTPYLVRGSDGAVTRFERTAPRWFLDYLEVYHRWLERFSHGRAQTMVRQVVRRKALQIGLNVTLITGIFMVAAWVAGPATRWWPHVPQWLGNAGGVVWMCAALAGLPLLIAVLRQFRALSLLLAEVSVDGMSEGTGKAAVTTLLSNTMLLAATVALGLWILLINATLLPPLPGLVVMLLILLIVATVFVRFFVQIHSRAELALGETLSQTPPHEESPPQAPLPSVLREAQLETVTIPDPSVAVGKLIRELELRSTTGASIVAIERGTNSIVNPGPDEELQPGDKVLLLGLPEQLAAAQTFLSEPATKP